MAQDTGRHSTRKQALQDRSQAMVDAILDGAVSAFMSVAAPVYDADAETKSPSVNRIAKIAGVSIGSLYQYFPGKRAIVAALVRRRMRQIHERLFVVLEQSSDLSLEEAAARFVDCMLQMKVTNTASATIAARKRTTTRSSASGNVAVSSRHGALDAGVTPAAGLRRLRSLTKAERRPPFPGTAFRHCISLRRRAGLRSRRRPCRRASDRRRRRQASRPSASRRSAPRWSASSWQPMPRSAERYEPP
jgi:AcrR family transcriptional regulator